MLLQMMVKSPLFTVSAAVQYCLNLFYKVRTHLQGRNHPLSLSLSLNGRGWCERASMNAMCHEVVHSCQQWLPPNPTTIKKKGQPSKPFPFQKLTSQSDHIHVKVKGPNLDTPHNTELSSSPSPPPPLHLRLRE